jgi:YidC/Oxa1 family membrane protein insertase
VDKRTLLAMVLCLFIFIGWMWLSQKLWPPPPPAPPKRPDAAQTTKPPPEKTEPAKVEPAKAVEGARYDEKPPIPLRSKYLDVTLTNRGAGVETVDLHYPKPDDKVHILTRFDEKIPHLALRHVGGPDAIESLPWEIVEQTSERVEFRFRLQNGVEIRKILVLDQDHHTLQMTLMLDNKNPAPSGKSEPPDVDMKLEVVAFNGMNPDSLYRYENYLMGVSRYDHAPRFFPLAQIEKGERKLADGLKLPEGKEKTDEIRKIEEEYFRVVGGRKEYFGIKNRYFASLMLPDDAAKDALSEGYYSYRFCSPEVNKAMGKELQASGKEIKAPGKDNHNLLAAARTGELRVGGSRKELRFTIYCGPLEKETIRIIPGGEDLVGYTSGCLPPWIVKPAATVILELLRITGRFLPMGLAIILTTLIIRLCMFPLSLKSQRNALQMQALAPKIQALKERYKDDQQKYGVEQMRLFKEHKVNPVAGCLPVFIQLPIFVGMYSVFEMAIELRKVPFLWAKDLSEPDRLFGGNWGIVIPMPLIPNLQIDSFNLLPILMMITWFLQAYLAPRSPDPQMAQQQKMMMWMPIVFGLSCYGLASGLSVYFLANSLLSMAEQKIIKKYILKVPPGGPGTAPGPGIEKK